jgi:tol-pal system protein YbgF
VTARRALLVPLVALAAGACASRGDIRVLQNDLSIMRAEAAMNDSSHRAQLARIDAQLNGVRDSVRAANARLYKFQGDVQGMLYTIGQQLIAIQELTGQTQRRLQDFRAQVEQRGATLSPAPLGSSDSSAAGVAATGAVGGTPPAGPPTGGGAPGPNQLYQLSLNQLQRGSAGAARSGFEELLRRYPTFDLAGEAQFYIAESYAAEKDMSAADSAYALVVERYPSSPRAPTALYKRALSLQKAGQTREARQTFETLVKKYPRSDEAELARDILRTLR